MSSIRAITTIGTVVLAVTLFQSQAVGQANPSSTDSSQTANGTAAFPGYTGFIDDEGADETVPDGAFIDEDSATGFISYVQDDEPDVTELEILDAPGDDGISCYGPLFHSPWVTLEYMHAWTRGRWLPPLVTGGATGVLPGSPVRFGDEYVGTGLQASSRVSLGAWFNEEETIGVGARFFALEGDKTGYAAASNAAGIPLIARPFYNTDPNPVFNGPDALIVTGPGLRTGDLRATATNDVLGAETYMRYNLLSQSNRRADLLIGYQFTRIDDSLNVNHRMTQLGGTFPVGTQFEFNDLFDVRNEFHGLELGLQTEYDRGPFTLSIMGKMSIGNMQETLTISGWSTRTPPAGVATLFPRHGLLAMPTNDGTYSRDDFAVIPEAEIKLTCRLTSQLEASLGYSFLYWSDVALAGQQVDMSMGQPTVNGTQLLGGGLFGPGNPAFVGIRDTDFWLQALSFGITFKH